jgi:methionyl-tRNA formyltransferase
MKRVLFLGSKPIGYYCLQHLISYHNTEIQIVGVLSNDNAVFGAQYSVTQLAVDNNIAVFENLETLADIDILISVQYHKILKQHEIDKAALAINLHMAPLPEYRGCNQFSMAILNDAKTFGTTIHKMDAKIDNGPIGFESRFEIPTNTWVQELYKLTETKSIALFKNSWPLILNNNITWTPQQQLVEARGTSLHFRNEMASLKQIDLNWPAEKIERHYRATYMPGFAPPFTIINNKKVNLTLDLS